MIEVLSKVGLAFFVILLSLGGTATTSFAHTGSQWWFETWPSGDVKYDMTVGVPGTLGSSYHDEIAEGGKKWNALTNFITFKRSGNEVANFGDAQACNNPSAIHWTNHSSGVAYTLVCQNFFGTVLDRFQITFDSDLPMSEGWYWGFVGVPQGILDYPVQGVSGHEFGHGAGGWHSSESGHFDPTETPNLCGSSVPLADLHTMCSNISNAIGTTHENSLETHDKHTFQHWYP